MDILCTLSNRYCNVDTVDDSVTGSFQQIDLNRHLEEIAQSVEAILVHHTQNLLLSKWSGVANSTSIELIKLARSWESYSALNCTSNGMFIN